MVKSGKNLEESKGKEDKVYLKFKKLALTACQAGKEYMEFKKMLAKKHEGFEPYLGKLRYIFKNWKEGKTGKKMGNLKAKCCYKKKCQSCLNKQKKKMSQSQPIRMQPRRNSKLIQGKMYKPRRPTVASDIKLETGEGRTMSFPLSLDFEVIHGDNLNQMIKDYNCGIKKARRECDNPSVPEEVQTQKQAQIQEIKEAVQMTHQHPDFILSPEAFQAFTAERSQRVKDLKEEVNALKQENKELSKLGIETEERANYLMYYIQGNHKRLSTPSDIFDVSVDSASESEPVSFVDNVQSNGFAAFQDMQDDLQEEQKRAPRRRMIPSEDYASWYLRVPILEGVISIQTSVYDGELQQGIFYTLTQDFMPHDWSQALQDIQNHNYRTLVELGLLDIIGERDILAVMEEIEEKQRQMHEELLALRQ